MTQKKDIIIDPLSANSLLLKLSVNSLHLGTATGFVVVHNDAPYLVTNWHVLSGINPETHQPMHGSGAYPDEVAILHHIKDKLGQKIEIKESLYISQGEKRWLEHPLKEKVDVVMLPLVKVPPFVQIYGFDLSLSLTDMTAEPAMPASIIGYPFGLTTGGIWPIWKTGHIASDPDLDYENSPAFLIDATTRGGMSGSPVVLRLSGGYRDRNRKCFIISAGIATLFLGIYSARVNRDAEIGKVWRPHVIDEILSHNLA